MLILIKLGNVVDQWHCVRFDIEGSLVRDSTEALCCALEQETPQRHCVMPLSTTLYHLLGAGTFNTEIMRTYQHD